jgi:hypothetical protein
MSAFAQKACDSGTFTGVAVTIGRPLDALRESLNPGDGEDIHAVLVGQGGHLPARVCTFIVKSRRSTDVGFWPEAAVPAAHELFRY